MLMLNDTVATISSLSDLIIFFAYLFVGSALIYNIIFKLRLKKSFFVFCFCGFIFICALNHLSYYLQTLGDYSLFVTVTKALKAVSAIITSLAVWPFLKEALYFKSLKENEKQKRDLKIFEEAYNDAAIGLALLDKEGNLIKANKEIIKLFGYREEYLINNNIYQFIDKEDALSNKKLFKRIYKSHDEVFDFNLKFKTKSNNKFLGKVQVKLHRKECGEIDFFAIQVTDISHEQEIENELQRERVNAENDRKLDYLKEMASSIAHEINNPLTIISGAAQITDLIIKRDIVDKELVHKEIQDITESVLRISKIIKSLKVLSSKKMEQLELFTVSEILDNVISLNKSKFETNDINFIINQNENVFLKEILCNKMHMTQVFINLFNNSFEALEDSNKKWIKLNLYEQDRNIVFEISDSGPGMNEEDKNKIYLPFYSSKNNNESTGLGLSYCKSVIENYQGRLEQVEGKNTTFRVTIPLDRELKFA